MLLMLSALLAAAPLAESAAHGPQPRPPACAVVEVRSDQAPRAWYRFRATRILDLELETRVLGRRHDTRAPQLRLYTPDGFLYQVLETRARARRGGERRFEARLPVAGTSIMTERPLRPLARGPPPGCRARSVRPGAQLRDQAVESPLP